MKVYNLYLKGVYKSMVTYKISNEDYNNKNFWIN